MASNVMRALSRRVCLGLKTRSMAEVRALPVLSTPVTQANILNAQTTLISSLPLELEKRLQQQHQLSVIGRRAHTLGGKHFGEEEPPVLERVLNVCKSFDKINAEMVTEESHFMNDLGLDSLDHVELIMAAEDEFGFEIPDVDAERLLTVKTLIEYIDDKLGGQVDLFEDMVPVEYPVDKEEEPNRR